MQLGYETRQSAWTEQTIPSFQKPAVSPGLGEHSKFKTSRPRSILLHDFQPACDIAQFQSQSPPNHGKLGFGTNTGALKGGEGNDEDLGES